MGSVESSVFGVSAYAALGTPFTTGIKRQCVSGYVIWIRKGTLI